VLRVRFQVADVGLGVAARAVKEHQHRLAGVAGVQIAGAHSAGIEETLRERDALKGAPDALEFRGREERFGFRGREERFGFRGREERFGFSHSSPLLTARIRFSYLVSTLLIYRTCMCTIVRASLS
jgi:hypothetical protein